VCVCKSDSVEQQSAGTCTYPPPHMTVTQLLKSTLYTDFIKEMYYDADFCFLGASDKAPAGTQSH
jgi:hypothetical protein